MAKTLKKLLASCLAVSMCMSMVTTQAFAEEAVVDPATNPEPVKETVENEDGTTTQITTTTELTTDETGDLTVVVKIEKDINEQIGDNMTNDGVTVNLDAERTEEYDFNGTDENGAPVKGELEHYVDEGTETREWTEEDSGDKPGQPPVTVELKPGETTTGTASNTTIEGEDTDKSDGEWDYTETTTTDRTVTAKTSKSEVTVNDSNTGLVEDQEAALKGLAPVYDETDEYDLRKDGRIDDPTGKDGLFDRNYLSASNTDPSKWTDIPPEGEYRYVGTGEHSKYFVGLAKVIYKKDADGNTIYDEDGNPVIEKLVNNVNGTDHTSGGELVDELIPEYAYDAGFASSRAQNFMLMDKDGNKVFAYCCDAQTGAVNGKWYSVSNLEDSDYYTPEAEEHIRSIAINGYWGTSDVAKDDGTYETGSLESIKQNLLKAIEDGEIDQYVKVPVRDTSTEGAGKIRVDENGNPIYHEKELDLVELIANMTEGEALLATQAAIWSFANGSQAATSGIDGPVVVTPDWYRNHQIGYGKVEGEPLDDAAGARVTTLYNWLINLETEEDSTIVINEKNFVEDMSLTVGDKVEGHAANQDADEDNDVYNTDLNFKLAFVPGDNDDLLVQITYTDLDGKLVNVVRRLAGENAEGQTYEDIKPEADGSYVLKGLKLSENENFDFDLRLEGTQYLEQGVYVYAPVGGRDVSQTFVGVAEGERNVDVSIGVTVSFDVDEDDHVRATRTWREEGPDRDPGDDNGDDDVTPPGDDDDDDGVTPPGDDDGDDDVTPPDGNEDDTELGENDVPLTNLPEVDVPQEETEDNFVDILDEEIPLANIPKTGDTSAMWMLMSALSGSGLLGLVLTGKKRKED